MVNYRLGSIIGSGSYGLVFRAVEVGSETAVALKKSRVSLRVQRTILRHESRVLQLLQGHPAIPALYGYGQLPHFEFLSMELLGSNAKELLVNQVRVQTVVRVVQQMLSALSHVHKLGIVHRDIKPENLLISLSDPSKMLLIDFGISRLIHKGVPSQYNPLKESRNIVGTLHWASINAHDGIDLAPRDDLESLAYVALFLLRGDLPWRSGPNSESTQQSMARIRASKAECTGAALATNFPLEFGELLDHSRQLEFDQIPDYNDLELRFTRLADRLRCQPHDPLDWTPPDVPTPTSAPKSGEIADADDSNEDEDEGYDDEENFSNSYFDLDIGDWDIQGNRDPDLTFPGEQADMLDSCVPQISQVDEA
ncbi:putative casein kinase-1 hhp1 [Mycena alexandri]|uniref:non-specific serine/threonine protein kinase n=1 Tax=Mycena alexandri TaxID=1745969 RepID=A0AAD6T0H9_9AGAR|nr:putative casein kinase-1 hhp1 [Mycena alexandri]